MTDGWMTARMDDGCVDGWWMTDDGWMDDLWVGGSVDGCMHVLMNE